MLITLGQIRQFLSDYQPRESRDTGLKRAAVLIPVFQKNGALHLLFTRRTESVEHHKGQISFPGGAVDEHDAGAVATALRETEEEIGLAKASVEILGVFDDYATPSGYSVTPVVGYITTLPRFAPSSHEVAELFDAPLDFFLDKNNERIVNVIRQKKMRDVYFYNYGQYEIWGVTAAILRAFLGALKSARV
ncbi:MAG TPA: CoA pyrophosphatase [Bacteroidota bacterium]